MADGLIDPNSDNVVDNTPPLVLNDNEVIDFDEHGDLTNDYRDVTKYGLDHFTVTDLDKLAGLLGLVTNVDLTNVQAAVRAAQSNASANNLDRPDAYEFRISPLSSTNASDLPLEGILLPLPPEKFDVTRSSDPRTFVSVNQRQYSLPGSKDLASVSLEGMFPYSDPDKWGSFGKPNYLPRYITKDNFKTPTYLVKAFSKLMSNAQPFNLTVGDPPGSTSNKEKGGFSPFDGKSMTFTVVSFSWGEAFGHIGSYVFSLELKQWKPTYPETPSSTSSTTTTGTTGSTGGSKTPKPPRPVISRPQTPAPKPRVYTIKSGDTLWDISVKYLGDGNQWKRIYSLNKRVLEDACKKNGASIYPHGWHLFAGTKIKIPDRRRAHG